MIDIQFGNTKMTLGNVRSYRKHTKARGDHYKYHHLRTGQRLPDDPNTREFYLAWTDEEAKVEAKSRQRLRTDEAGVKTLEDLINLYSVSKEFRKKNAISTQKTKGYQFPKLIAALGKSTLATMNDPVWSDDIQEWHEDFTEELEREGRSPTTANRYKANLCAILSWAVKKRYIIRNASLGIEDNVEGDRSEFVWTQEDVKSLLAVQPTKNKSNGIISDPRAVQWVVLFAYSTGQRRSDILKVGPQHREGDTLSYLIDKVKTGKKPIRVTFPIPPSMKDFFDATPPDQSHYFLSTRGEPWTGDGFKTSLRTVRKKTKVNPELTFNDLRGTAISEMSNGGATVQMIGGYTGHTFASIHKILERYTNRNVDLSAEASRRRAEYLPTIYMPESLGPIQEV